MAGVIPLTNDGCRSIEIKLGEKNYKLETYYMPFIKCWLLDIYDDEDNPIILGINLKPGIQNLVRGLSEFFEEQAMMVVTTDGGNNDTPESMGNTAFLLYFAKGDKLPQLYEDKLLNG